MNVVVFMVGIGLFGEWVCVVWVKMVVGGGY